MQLIEIFDLVSARLDAMQMSGREFSKLLNYPENWFNNIKSRARMGRSVDSITLETICAAVGFKVVVMDAREAEEYEKRLKNEYAGIERKTVKRNG